jgi:hypothetical protein
LRTEIFCGTGNLVSNRFTGRGGVGIQLVYYHVASGGLAGPGTKSVGSGRVIKLPGSANHS